MVSEDENITISLPLTQIKNYINMEFRNSFDVVNLESVLKDKNIIHYENMIKIRALCAGLDRNSRIFYTLWENIDKEVEELQLVEYQLNKSIAQSSLYSLLIANHIYKRQDRLLKSNDIYEYVGKLEPEITERLSNLIPDNATGWEEFSKIQNLHESEIYLLSHPAILDWKVLDFIVTLILCFKVEENYQLMSNTAFQCVSLKIILHEIVYNHRNPTECIKKFFRQIVVDRDYRLKFLINKDLLILGIVTIEKTLKSTFTGQAEDELLENVVPETVVEEEDHEETSDLESTSEEME